MRQALALSALVSLSSCAHEATDLRPMTSRDWYQAGVRQYQMKQYEQALDAFENAYLLHPDPVLLFDIAQSNRRLGRLDEALSAYKGYLKQLPPGHPRRSTVEKLIEETRRERRRN